MQEGTITEACKWEDIQHDYKVLAERVKELEQENEQLLKRLQLSEAYRFCDKSKIIVN